MTQPADFLVNVNVNVDVDVRVDFNPRGPLRRRRSLEVGRERRLKSLRERLPYRVLVVPDPLLLLETIGVNYITDDNPNDAATLLNAMKRVYDDGRGHILIGDFNTHRSKYNMAGRTPASEPDQRLDFVTPGPLPETIQPSDLAMILEEPGQAVYTVENMSIDRIRYMAHLSLHLFSNRRLYVP